MERRAILNDMLENDKTFAEQKAVAKRRIEQNIGELVGKVLERIEKEEEDHLDKMEYIRAEQEGVKEKIKELDDKYAAFEREQATNP